MIFDGHVHQLPDIDPTETRKLLIDGLRMLESKKEELPPRKHGTMPL